MKPTDNERLINLCKAIDEFHCPREVKQQALKVLGITSETVYHHPLQQQMDKINKLFDGEDDDA
jgi:hypothetical protein